jgi:hypothetical protein
MKQAYIVYYIIVFFSVVITRLLDGNLISIPMLAIMYASPILLLFKVRYLNKSDVLLFIVLLAVWLSAIFHPERFRLSTVMYTSLFVVTFTYYKTLLRSVRVSEYSIMRLFEIIVKSYAVMIFIQQVGGFIGLPEINQTSGAAGLKMNGLSYEASHSGPIVVLLFYGYIKLFEHINKYKPTLKQLFKIDKYLVIALFYTCILTSSVASVFSLIILLLYLFPIRRFYTFIPLALVFALVMLYTNSDVYTRVANLVVPVLSLDIEAIYEVDASAGARIVPFIVIIKEFDLSNINLWVGYGCDYGGLYMMSQLIGHDAEVNIGVGGIINQLLDYGLIFFVPYLLSVTQITKFKSYDFLMYMSLFFVTGINVYLTWLFFIVIYTVKYFTRKKNI